jgi:imidazolonepropionase-like amidohydrolase
VRAAAAAAGAGLALAAGTLAWSAWPPAARVPAAGEISIEDVVLVTPGEGAVYARRLVVRARRIESIEGGRPGEAAPRFVLPGLVDMHVHLPPATAPGLVDLFGLLFLAHGVTTIREVGSLDGASFALAGEIEGGERPGPRIAACGPILDGAPPAWPVARALYTREEGGAVVGDLAGRGARCVKVLDGISREALAGIHDAARRLGLPVIGHISRARPLSDPGLDDVQHLCGARCAAASPEEIEAFVESSVRQGIAHTPTLVVFEGQRLLAEGTGLDAHPGFALLPRFWRESLWRPVVREPNADALASMQALVRRLHARGVRLHAGTDPLQAFVVPGASLRRELELLVEAGLSIEEALAAATWVAGESLGIAGLGRIGVGAPADLLVLRADPRHDLAALDTIEAVIAGGRLYTVDELRAALDMQLRYFERPVVSSAFRLAAGVAFGLGRRAFETARSKAP